MSRTMKVVVSCFAFFVATFAAAESISTRAEPLTGPSGVAAFHALAMTAVFTLAFVACALLLRAGWWGPAVLTAAGAVLGPFVLLAPPWSSALGPNTSGEPATPVVAQALVGAVVIGWILLTAHLSLDADARGRLRYSSAAYGVPLAAIVVAMFLWPNGLTDPGHGDLALRVALGWALLSAGIVAAGIATASLARDRVAIVMTRLLPMLALVVVGAMYGAYNSTGGWPQVAGWSYAQAPLYATVATAALLVLSALLAAAAPEVVRLVTRREAPASPSPSDEELTASPVTA